MSKCYLKAPSTPLNGSSGSVISGITTPFALRNIDQNYPSVKNITKLFPVNSVNFEGTRLMSNFDNKSLKKLLLNKQLHINVLLPNY